MKVTITYNELSDIIINKFNVQLNFITVDDRTIEVSYNPCMFIPTIKVRLHIETFHNDIVCMSYEYCTFTTALTMDSAVPYLMRKIPSGIKVNTNEKRISIYPQNFKSIKDALEYVNLSDITLEENSAKVTLTMV